MGQKNCKHQNNDPREWATQCSLPIKNHGLCTTHLDAEKKRLASEIDRLNRDLYLTRNQLDKLSM